MVYTRPPFTCSAIGTVLRGREWEEKGLADVAQAASNIDGSNGNGKMEA